MVRQTLFAGAGQGEGREWAGDHGISIGTTAMRCCSGGEIELNSDPNKDSDNLLAKQQGRGQWLENYSLHLFCLL